MKTVILLLLCQLAYSQEKEQKIYKYNNGIRELLQTIIIVDEREVYKAVDGIRDITPILIIEDNKVFKTENGVPEFEIEN